jgi:hypothetical protein
MRRQILTVAAMSVGSLIYASGAMAQWSLGGTYECVGRLVGNGGAVRVNCSQEQTRGNQIITNVFTFKIRGPVAPEYIGRHDECWHIEPADTRMNQDVVTCPGIHEWWK